MLLRKSYYINNVKCIEKNIFIPQHISQFGLDSKMWQLSFYLYVIIAVSIHYPYLYINILEVLLNNRKKITPSSLLFSIISFGNFWRALSPVGRGYHWSRFSSLLGAVLAWLAHWARGRFRQQTQVLSMADKFCFCPYSSCFQCTVSWLFTPLKSKKTFHVVVLLSVVKRHRFLLYSR